MTFGRVNPGKTRSGQGERHFNSYGLLKIQDKIRLLTTPHYIHEEISEFATTYPFTNDYPFDFAQSLLLLHKREVVVLGSARYPWYSGLVFVCVASRGSTELVVGSDNMDGLFFAIPCYRLFPDFE